MKTRWRQSSESIGRLSRAGKISQNRSDDVVQRTGRTQDRSLPKFFASRIFVAETILGETPVRSSVADRIIHNGDVYIARPRRCAAEVPAPRAPIDNRWNKKLEFVYSLVTQIRAAARHPRPTPSDPPLSAAPPHCRRRLRSTRASVPLPAHHHRRRTYLVTTRMVPTPAER